MSKYYKIGTHIEIWDVGTGVGTISHQYIPLESNSILVRMKNCNIQSKRGSGAIIVDGYVTDCNYQIEPILLSTFVAPYFLPERRNLFFVPFNSDFIEYEFGGGNTKFDIAIAAELF